MVNQCVLKSRFGYFSESLSKIPLAFGFDPIDTRAILTTCFERLEGNVSHSELSANLTKAVVKECIYRLSILYFNDASPAKSKKACLQYSFEGSRPAYMPLPYKAVYILQKQGYPKPQIAEILNTSIVTVSQYLALAQQYVGKAA